MKRTIIIAVILALALCAPVAAFAEDSAGGVVYTDVPKEDFLSSKYARQIDTKDSEHLATLTSLSDRLEISGTGYSDSAGLKFGVVWSVPVELSSASVKVSFPDIVEYTGNEKNECYVVAFNNSATFWREDSPSVYFVIRGRSGGRVSVECTGYASGAGRMSFATHNGMNEENWVELDDGALTISVSASGETGARSWSYSLNGGASVPIDAAAAVETLNAQFEEDKSYLNVTAAIDGDLTTEMKMDILDIDGLMKIMEVVPGHTENLPAAKAPGVDFVGTVLPILLYVAGGMFAAASVVFYLLHVKAAKCKKTAGDEDEGLQ